MLYEVITDSASLYFPASVNRSPSVFAAKVSFISVITSYSIHYTKLYEKEKPRLAVFGVQPKLQDPNHSGSGALHPIEPVLIGTQVFHRADWTQSYFRWCRDEVRLHHKFLL